MKFRLAHGGVLLLLVAAACGSTSPGARPPPTDRASSTVAPPTTTVNPDVIPTVITPAYVNAVLGVLNHVDGNAFRLEVADGTISPPELTDLRAIYNDPEYAMHLQVESVELLELSLAKPNPGDPSTTVVNLMTAEPSCVFAQVTTDLDAITKAPTPSAPSEFVMLQPKTPGNDPQGLNTTPWAIALDVTYQTPTTMPSQCPG